MICSTYDAGVFMSRKNCGEIAEQVFNFNQHKRDLSPQRSKPPVREQMESITATYYVLLLPTMAGKFVALERPAATV